MSLYSAFKRAVEAHGMIGPDGCIVAAVSGGPDSMALLECLCEFAGAEGRARIIVAHLHHQLRDTADRDAQFVRAEADKRGATPVIGRTDANALAAEEKLSIEEAARNARYQFLLRVAIEHGAETILTGHNADDQAETVLMRALRGTGIHGLAGMSAVRPAGPATPGVRIARPLLSVPRSAIETFLCERGVTYCEDETNRDEKYRRNLVRLKLMPLIRDQLQPRATEVLCRLAESARQAQSHMVGTVCAFMGDISPDDAAVLTAREWQTVPTALRATLLMELYREVTGGGRMPHVHVETLRSLMDSSGTGALDLPGEWRATVDATGLTIAPMEERAEAAAPWAVSLSIPGSVTLPDGRVMTAATGEYDGSAAPRTLDANAPEEWLDYDRIGRPKRLVARSRLPGDRFSPLGAPGSRSVKRFLIDIKAPREERSRVPVVAVPGADVIWVAPYRIDARSRLSVQTREVLRIALE